MTVVPFEWIRQEMESMANQGHNNYNQLSKFVMKKRQDLEEMSTLVGSAFFLLNKYVTQTDKVVKDILKSKWSSGQEEDLQSISDQVQALKGVIIDCQNSVQHKTVKEVKSRLDKCLRRCQDQGSHASTQPVNYVSPTMIQQPFQRIVEPNYGQTVYLNQGSQYSLTPIQVIGPLSGVLSGGHVLNAVFESQTTQPSISITPILPAESTAGQQSSFPNQVISSPLRQEQPQHVLQRPILPRQAHDTVQEENNTHENQATQEGQRPPLVTSIPITPSTSSSQSRQSLDFESQSRLVSQLRCPFCSIRGHNFSRPNKYVLLQHLKISHKEKVMVYEQISSLLPSVESSIGGHVTCFYCPLQERSKAPLLRHIHDSHQHKFDDFRIVSRVFNKDPGQVRDSSQERQEERQEEGLPRKGLHKTGHPSSPESPSKDKNNARKSQTAIKRTSSTVSFTEPTAVKRSSFTESYTQETATLSAESSMSSQPKTKRTRKVQAELNKNRHSCHLCPQTFSSKNALELHTNFYCEKRTREDKAKNLIPSLPVKTSEVVLEGRSSSQRRLRSHSSGQTVKICQVRIVVESMPQELLLKLMRRTKENGQETRNKRIMDILQSK